MIVIRKLVRAILALLLIACLAIAPLGAIFGIIVLYKEAGITPLMAGIYISILITTVMHIIVMAKSTAISKKATKSGNK